VFSLDWQMGNVPASRCSIAMIAPGFSPRDLCVECNFVPKRPRYTFSPVAILVLIVLAGALGTFLGIITVILKNERTTNRHHLLSNIPGSIALSALVCVVPGGLAYVVTENIPVTGLLSLASGFVIAWLIEALDH
jgi:hypothetical protein